MASQPDNLSISNVVSNITGVITRNPLIFLGLSLVIVGIPQLLIGLISTPDAASSSVMTIFENPAALAGGALAYLAFIVLSIVLQASLVVATVNDLSGKPVDFASCINRAFSKFFPLVGLGIVMSFGIAIGFLLIVIPGIILYLMWMVSSPVLMVEGKGVFDSLSRSRALTSGNRWKLLGIVIVFIVFSIIVSIPFGIFTLLSPVLGVIGSALASAITSAVSSAGVASIYIELRNMKDGTDTSTLADVFS